MKNRLMIQIEEDLAERGRLLVRRSDEFDVSREIERRARDSPHGPTNNVRDEVGQAALEQPDAADFVDDAKDSIARASQVNPFKERPPTALARHLDAAAAEGRRLALALVPGVILDRRELIQDHAVREAGQKTHAEQLRARREVGEVEREEGLVLRLQSEVQTT